MRTETTTGRRAAPGAATLTVLTALLVVCVTAACEAPRADGSARPARPSPSSLPAAPPVVAGAQLVVVARVVDGDTLLLTGGERVRVLGIDSCEASTPQGPAATAAARGFVGEGAVVLGVEPGVERDRYGRLLRYVSVPGRDASPAYRARLTARDDGRACD